MLIHPQKSHCMYTAMGVGRSVGEARTPAPKGPSAGRDRDRLGSPDYVPSKGDGASPSILQAHDGPLACQTAIGWSPLSPASLQVPRSQLDQSVKMSHAMETPDVEEGLGSFASYTGRPVLSFRDLSCLCPSETLSPEACLLYFQQT